MLWAFAPAELPQRQTIEDLTASMEHQIERDTIGNAFLQFDLGTIPPFGKRTFSVSAKLRLFDITSSTRRSSSKEDLAVYLEASEYIEADAPEIRKIADSLKRSNGAAETTRRIYEWVSSHVTYSGATGKDRGALFACRSGRGDCTDVSFLVAALGRAAGIPSRVVGGFICGQSTNLSPDDYHNWAECLVDGKWWIVDVTEHQLLEHSDSYVVFQIHGAGEGQRLVPFKRFLVEGEGLVVRMKT